jgi:ribonuclease BN (tRNA processing enzyme)
MELYPTEQELMRRERDDYRKLVESIDEQAPCKFDSAVEITCIGNAGGADNLVHGHPAGGLLLRHSGRTVIVDPGDNCICHLVGLGFNPYEITDVLASHAHSDHVGDLVTAVSAAVNLALGRQRDSYIITSPMLVDYSTASSTKFGYTLPVFAWKGNVVALYREPVEARRFDGTVIHSCPSVSINEHLTVSAAEACHGQLQVTGFVIDTPLGRLAYTSDTEYFDTLVERYRGSDVLWMNMNTLSLESMRDLEPDPPCDAVPIHNHLGYVGVCRLIEEVRPRIAIVSHLGSQLLDKREAIQHRLRTRFAGTGVDIYCPDNGDSFLFRDSLSRAPLLRGFTP